MGLGRREFKVAGQMLLRPDWGAVNHTQPRGRGAQQREQRWLTKRAPALPQLKLHFLFLGLFLELPVINAVPITRRVRWRLTASWHGERPAVEWNNFTFKTSAANHRLVLCCFRNSAGVHKRFHTASPQGIRFKSAFYFNASPP